MSYYIDGKRVKLYWFVVLTAAQDAGVKFTLNSGNRTMEEQSDLRRKYLSGTGNLAAIPAANAPHIRVGREDHAIDVDSLDGGETRLQRWLQSEGARMSNPVHGESWHMEINPLDLKKLYLRYKASMNYPAKARAWIREYDRIRRNRPHTMASLKRRSVLKREMAKLRKTYFGKPRYAKVYAALLKRSR